LIAQVAESIRGGVVSTLAPAVRRILEAAADLERALAGATGRKRRGRPPKSASAAAGVKRGPGRPKGSGKRKKAPRGALKKAIGEALKGAPGGLTLTAIRDAVAKSPDFRGRNPMTLYRQIARDVRKVPRVHKTPKGTYAIK
jgi:hypothetical protein